MSGDIDIQRLLARIFTASDDGRPTFTSVALLEHRIGMIDNVTLLKRLVAVSLSLSPVSTYSWIQCYL